MQRSLLIVLALCLTASACRRSSTDQEAGSPGQEASSSTETADLGGFLIAAPVRYQNLAIFPVLSKVPKTEDRYITLEEGLKAGTVEIYEVGADGARIDSAAEEPAVPENGQEGPMQPEADEPPAEGPSANEPPAGEEPSTQADPQQMVVREGIGEAMNPPPVATEDVAVFSDQEVAGDVNRLMVLNRSGRPLYLMPGEVIYGGKQDRTIGEETIILASAEPQPIDVYCVEQGRWSGRSEEEAAADLTVLAYRNQDVDEETLKKLAAEANRGKFVASAGNLSKKSRLAVQAGKGPEAQQEVWNRVAGANAAADLEAPSGAFTANYASTEVVDQLKPYIEKLQAPVAGQKQVVGAIVAVNGKIESVDVFGSTPLFRKLWPKLLKSHALDAANAADAPEAKTVCKLDDAQKFFASAMQADVNEKEVEGGLVVTRRESQGVVSFSAAPEDASAAPGMGMGGFGGSVHSSAFAK